MILKITVVMTLKKSDFDAINLAYSLLISMELKLVTASYCHP
jgi:hypothetical protein